MPLPVPCRIRTFDAPTCMAYGLQRLVAPHAPHVNLLLEVELFLVHLILCLLADEGALRDLFLDLVVADLFQLLQLNGALDHAKSHNRLFAADG